MTDGSDAPRFVGLDIETTGSEFTDRIKLIQVGVYDPVSDELFRSNVGWYDDEFDMVDEATAVHGIPRDAIVAAMPSCHVDAMLRNWLVEHGITSRAIPVGFNVGTFDMPFVRRDLPETAKFFGYRSLDLNSVLFSLARAYDIDWKSLKQDAKDIAQASLARSMPGINAHDAGYDAKEAYLVWQWCVANIVSGYP